MLALLFGFILYLAYKSCRSGGKAIRFEICLGFVRRSCVLFARNTANVGVQAICELNMFLTFTLSSRFLGSSTVVSSGGGCSRWNARRSGFRKWNKGLVWASGSSLVEFVFEANRPLDEPMEAKRGIGGNDSRVFL